MSPVRVIAGEPGSRPRGYRGEIPAAERGVEESLFGGSKRAGCDCSLVRVTIGEPSRSCHGEGHVRQSWFRKRAGRGVLIRGRGSCTRARSDHGTRETRLSSLVSKDRSYKPVVKSSGGQRESEGAVVVRIGVQNNAPGAKGPHFGRGRKRGTRQGMAGMTGPNHPGERRLAAAGSERNGPCGHSVPSCATTRERAMGSRQAAAAFGRGSSLVPRGGDSLWVASDVRVCGDRVAASGRPSVSRVRENRMHGSNGGSGNRLA